MEDIDNDAGQYSGPSKSQRKREMTALQDLGAELEALSKERLAKIDMPERLRDALLEAQRRLPAMVIDSLDEQVRRIKQFDADIGTIERRLSQQLRESPACKTLAEIPGVGLLTATAIVASMGSPQAFKDAREFAAWIGLVPRQTGTGGKVRQLGISKRGDAYLRTLLMHGARAVVRSDRSIQWPWLAELLKRRPYSVAVAAVANKLARTIWAVLAHGKAWQPEAWQAV